VREEGFVKMSIEYLVRMNVKITLEIHIIKMELTMILISFIFLPETL